MLANSPEMTIKYVMTNDATCPKETVWYTTTELQHIGTASRRTAPIFPRYKKSYLNRPAIRRTEPSKNFLCATLALLSMDVSRLTCIDHHQVLNWAVMEILSLTSKYINFIPPPRINQFQVVKQSWDCVSKTDQQVQKLCCHRMSEYIISLTVIRCLCISSRTDHRQGVKLSSD